MIIYKCDFCNKEIDQGNIIDIKILNSMYKIKHQEICPVSSKLACDDCCKKIYDFFEEMANVNNL